MTQLNCTYVHFYCNMIEFELGDTSLLMFLLMFMYL